MSFIWTVGVEALVRPQLQPTPPVAPPASSLLLLPTTRHREDTQTHNTEDTADSRGRADRRQKAISAAIEKLV